MKLRLFRERWWCIEGCRCPRIELGIRRRTWARWSSPQRPRRAMSPLACHQCREKMKTRPSSLNLAGKGVSREQPVEQGIEGKAKSPRNWRIQTCPGEVVRNHPCGNAIPQTLPGLSKSYLPSQKYGEFGPRSLVKGSRSWYRFDNVSRAKQHVINPPSIQKLVATLVQLCEKLREFFTKNLSSSLFFDSIALASFAHSLVALSIDRVGSFERSSVLLVESELSLVTGLCSFNPNMEFEEI